MCTIGMMIKSAKMNDTTPPNEMPPFQSTAASGTLPIEQTKDATATRGPINGPQILAAAGWSVKNSACQNESGIHAAAAPARKRPATRSRIMAAHAITKLWLTERKAHWADQASEKAAGTSDAHVHRGMTLHPSSQPAVSLAQRRLANARSEETPKQQRHEQDHQWTADKIRRG
jgi:hypothetical protein